MAMFHTDTRVIGGTHSWGMADAKSPQHDDYSTAIENIIFSTVFCLIEPSERFTPTLGAL